RRGASAARRAQSARRRPRALCRHLSYPLAGSPGAQARPGGARSRGRRRARLRALCRARRNRNRLPALLPPARAASARGAIDRAAAPRILCTARTAHRSLDSPLCRAGAEGNSLARRARGAHEPRESEVRLSQLPRGAGDRSARARRRLGARAIDARSRTALRRAARARRARRPAPGVGTREAGLLGALLQLMTALVDDAQVRRLLRLEELLPAMRRALIDLSAARV